jgi:hypothetical protein
MISIILKMCHRWYFWGIKERPNHNVTGKKRDWRHYRGQCDYFALYSAELNKVYLVPVNEVGATRAHLRLILPKNKNQYGYRMASNYELQMGPAGVEPATNQVE